jgi:hypothetical protein
MYECHLKICQRKYDKGHHANPTNGNITLLYGSKYVTQCITPHTFGNIIFPNERKVSPNGHQVEQILLLIMKAIS